MLLQAVTCLALFKLLNSNGFLDLILINADADKSVGQQNYTLTSNLILHEASSVYKLLLSKMCGIIVRLQLAASLCATLRERQSEK